MVPSRFVWAPMLRHLSVFIVITAILSPLNGCRSVSSVEADSGSKTLQGHLKGGEQPVVGASVQLYAVGTKGSSSAATPLLAQAVTTDSAGDFNMPNYTCPSASSAVYLLATGGNESLPNIGKSVPAIGLMAMLGPCGNITASTFIVVNEVSTIGSIWPLAATYMTSPLDVGFQPGDSGFANALTAVTQLVNVNDGSAAADLSPSMTAKLLSLADIIAACINSEGGEAGDGTICGNLFTFATPPNGTVPKDTITAAIDIAQNPTRNVSALYNLIPLNAPFEPALTASPSDWRLGLASPPATPVVSPGAGSFTSAVPVTISDSTSGATIYYTMDGSTPTQSSPVYTGAFMVSSSATINAIAMAASVGSAVASANLTVSQIPTQLAFVTQPTTAVAGATMASAVSVEILDAGNHLVKNATAPVTLALAASQAEGSLAGTLSQNATNGVAQFANLSISLPGQYTLEAVSNDLTGGTSNPFTITAAPANSGEQATSALAFTNTLGINIHLAYGNTLYTTNFPLILKSLQDLGIHHVRDGLVDYGTGPNSFYTEYQQLAADGIFADYITSIGQTEALIKAYPARVGGMEALEAPNEYDTSGDPNWATTLAAFLPVLQDAVHGPQPMTGVALFGPSLVNQNWTSSTANSYAQLGAVSHLFDYGNLHNYPGGRNPGTLGWTPQGYGSIAFAISAARQTWPIAPIVTTETGYWDDPSVAEYVPDSVMGRYMPRILLEQYLHGITRTYLYDLADTQLTDDSYGLLKTDGTQKPAYLSLQALMHLLSDTGSAYSTGMLAWNMTGAGADLHHLLMQKRNGTFLLALWVEEPSYDVNTQTAQTVSSQTLALQFGSAVTLSAIDTWRADGTMTTDVGSNTKTSSISITASDLLTVLEIKP